MNGRKARGFMTDRPLSTLPTVNIDFCNDSSRIADEHWGGTTGQSREPSGRKVKLPVNGKKTQGSKDKELSEQEIQEIMDLDDQRDFEDEENVPLSSQIKTTTRQKSGQDQSGKKRKLVIELSDGEDDDDNEDFM